MIYRCNRFLFSFILYSVLLVTLSCKDEPTGPEMDCHLNDLYTLQHHFLKAAAVFDVRMDPPLEIKNGIIEYALTYQWVFNEDNDPMPYPYSTYFIDSIAFLDPTSVRVHIFESNQSTDYAYTRDDCELFLTAPGSNLQLELTESGDEISEQRFAIYDHRKRGVYIDTQYVQLDTFLFIEFRLGAFSTYEEIIKEFAMDHPGTYDTISVELVQNKTRE